MPEKFRVEQFNKGESIEDESQEVIQPEVAETEFRKSDETDESVKDEVKKERKGVFESLKRSPTLSAIVLGLGLAIGALGLHTAEKLEERGNIKEKQQEITRELSALERLREKREKIEMIFGRHANPAMLGFVDKYYSEKDELLKRQKKSEQEEESFSFFERKRDIETERRKDTEHTETIEQPERTVVSDFIAGDFKIRKETLSKILDETYPQGWIDNEIGNITQTDKIEKMPAVYGSYKGRLALAICRIGDDSTGRCDIVFYGNSKKFLPYQLLRFLSHEIGHANDWESDNEMTLEERMDLLLAIEERLQSDDRFMSSYVEGINNKDEQTELYKKATEYWSEICETYFSDPTALHYDDFTLVNDHVKRTDPDFQVGLANTRRYRLMLAAYR